MFEVDRITEDGKKAIVGLLNEAMGTEYSHIVNYPRFIDHLINFDKMPEGSIPPSLEHLGKDSVRHLGETIKLIEELGGKPQWEIVIVARLPDPRYEISKQMKKEELSLSLWRQAKSVAEQSQVKGLGGILWSIRALRGLLDEAVGRNDVIRILGEMAKDEEHHIMLLQDAISALNIQTRE